MLPSLALEPPGGEHWIHEIKFDGYRTVVIIADGEGAGFHPEPARLVGLLPADCRGRQHAPVPFGSNRRRSRRAR
jgi:hypothetical protein